MTLDELEAKLTRARERTELGHYEEAELLCNEVLAELGVLLAADESNRNDAILLATDESDSNRIQVLYAHATLVHANIRFRHGDTTSSLAQCEEVLALADKWRLLPLQRLTWNLLGQIHTFRGSNDTALEYFDRVLSTAIESDRDLLSARAIGNIGIVYARLLNYPRAFEYYRQAMPLFIELGDQRMLGGTKVNIGTLYLALNRYEEALECFNGALEIFEELGERPFRLNAMTQIGVAYIKLEKYELALQHNLKLLAAFEELGSKPGIATTLTNVGVAHFLLDNYPQALEFHTKALAMNQELGQKGAVANSLANLGQVYHKLGRYINALEHLYKALELYEEIDQKDGISNCLSHIGHIYADPGFEGQDLAKAEELLLSSIATYSGTGQSMRHSKKYKYLSEVYEMQHRNTEALAYYKKYHTLEREGLNNEALQTAEKYRQEREVAEREKELALVKAKADAEMSVTTSLLHKVLPASIAHRLIKGEKVADYFSSVSILFADIVGFTPIASKMPARKVLGFLNYVFGEFDRIVEKHGCEKIKTIGDGYMAVAGAPVTCEDHAERITRAALEMMQDIILPDDIRASLPKSAQLNIRIGINIGPAFGGIVGENRFVYDLYSDAVNIAARMESHGEPGKIHVSDEFCFHLQNRIDSTGEDLGGIRFEEREEMEIKGKGKMTTYFLERA